jgi:hypothetical protein
MEGATPSAGRSERGDRATARTPPDYNTANARLTALATFMGSLSFVGMILSVSIMTARPREASDGLLIAESVNVFSLLAAIVLFLTSAVVLTSAYFESGVPLEVGVRRARRLNISGTALTFLAVAGLMLVAFNFTPQAYAYAGAAAAAPVVFVLLRWRQGIAL